MTLSRNQFWVLIMARMIQCTEASRLLSNLQKLITIMRVILCATYKDKHQEMLRTLYSHFE
jgi:hypothetical protein